MLEVIGLGELVCTAPAGPETDLEDRARVCFYQ